MVCHRVRRAPHQERREEPPLRRAIAGKARRGCVEMLDVVGELRVEEARGVFAPDVDHAELRERNECARGLHGVESGCGG